MATMWTTITGYSAIIAAGVGYVLYQHPQYLNKLLPQAAQPALEEAATQAKKPNKKRPNKAPGEAKAASSATDGGSGSRKRKAVEVVSNTVAATTAEGTKASIPRIDDEGMSNRDFAAQLQQAQAGTSLDKKDHKAPTKKERRAAAKNAQASKGPESPNLSAETSSAGGRDADDDLSSNETPPSSVPASRVDVSDMLEPTAAAPKSIRLTNVESTQQKKAAPKTFETVLTKKQRQRRQQAEENRQLREESDKIQEAKKQQQMRGARMAAGTSNQTKATTFTQNAWKPKSEEDKVETRPQVGGLLDTFDPESQQTSEAVSTAPVSAITRNQSASSNVNEVKNNLGDKKTEALAASGRERANNATKSNWADQVDVDEQDKWEKNLVEEQKWESVTSKKSKKKAKKGSENSTASDASSSVIRQPAPVSKAASAPKTNGGSGITNAQIFNRFQTMDGDNDAWEA